MLVVFIGGMALGATGTGFVANRIRRPLLAYAVVEGAIGGMALLFHPAFVGITGWAYESLLPAACSADSTCYASYAIATLLILPQSVLLGSTFPLMTAGVLRLDPARSGERIALFYFLNSFGAVVGVLASGFLLIPALGLPGTVLTAGLVNVALAFAVYAIQRRRQADRPAPVPSAASATCAPPPRAAVLLAVAAATGATSFMYEVVWTRMLTLVIGASTHSFELMLAAFILGLALGSLWIRRRIDGFTQPLIVLAVVQVLMGAFALATLPIYAASFDALAGFASAVAPTPQGYRLYLLFGAALSMAVMLPAAFFAGMTLPLLTALLMRRGTGERAIGWIYGANTFGSIVGVIVAVNLMLPLLGLRGSLIVAAGIDVALGIWLIALAPRPIADRRRLGFGLAVGGALLLAGASTPLDPLKLAAGVYRTGVARMGDDTEVVYHRDGKTATVDVLRSANDVLVLRTNGKTDASMRAPQAKGGDAGDEATQLLLAALPLLHRPDAAQVAVIGFGSGMTSAMLLESPRVAEVVTIEIEPAMIEGARAFLPRNSKAYDDARSRIVVDDAKAYFARAGRRFDIVVSEPSNPWVSGTASLFTEEFYARVVTQLAPGGVFAQWIHTYEFSSPLMASILRALRRNFSDYAIYESESGDLVIVAVAAGRLPPARDDVFAFDGLGAGMRELGIATAGDVARLRVARTATSDTIARAIDAPPNSDYFPYVDQNAARARFMRSSSDEWRSLRMAPVPLLDLIEGGGMSERLSRPRPLTEPLDALRQALYAEEAAAFAAALPGLPAEKAAATPVGENLAALGAVFGHCLPPQLAEAVWDRVVVLAAETIPQLPSADARAMWQQLADGKCAAALSSRQRLWLALFLATAARDAASIRQATAPLLSDAGNTPAQWQYLLAAEGAALAAMQDRKGLGRLLREHGDRLSPATRRVGWYAYLDGFAIARRRTPCAHSARPHPRPVLPNPPAARALSSKLSTTSNRACTTGTMTSCASRSRGCSVNGSWPRFQQLTISGPW